MWLRLAFDLGRVASGLFGRRVERKFKRALEEEKIYGGSIKVAGMDRAKASLANIQIALVIFSAAGGSQPTVSEDHPKTLPQAKRHKLSLLFTSLTILTTLDFITK